MNPTTSFIEKDVLSRLKLGPNASKVLSTSKIQTRFLNETYEFRTGTPPRPFFDGADPHKTTTQ